TDRSVGLCLATETDLKLYHLMKHPYPFAHTPLLLPEPQGAGAWCVNPRGGGNTLPLQFTP
ncbi:MAG: hypothetical protein K2J87_01120, partial [Muribaculaceae bacterium]|nr:hypothetical protein [Muribaculaceae bacterium]